MPKELLVAALLLLGVIVIVNATLLLWVSRSDHVTTHWTRPIRSVLAGRRHVDVEDAPTQRRRPLYVAERVGPAGETTTSSVAASAGRSSAEAGRSAASHPAPPAPPSATLPQELADLLWRPAPMALSGQTYESGSNGKSNGERWPADESRDGGPSVLARMEDKPGSDGASPLRIDPLTGLEGPASWSRIVAIENARLLRHRRPVTVVMAEVEGLRKLEERLGEEPVDRLLPVIADAFRSEARSSDWVARVGASRFAAFLPETDEIQAINYVERIRVFCEPWLASSAVPLRLAIGWSSPGASTDLEHAIAQAEARMHEDRRTPAKSFQPPHVGSPRVVSLAAGSPAAEGLSNLATGSVAPAETGRSVPRDGQLAAAPDGGLEPSAEPA